MSITRLQQARQMYALGQLVSKSMNGSRPGYRGDDAYGGGRDPSGPTGGAGEDNRQSYSATATQTGPKSAPKGQDSQDTKLDYLTTKYQDIDLTPTQRDNFRDFQKQVGYSISPSSKPSNRVLGGLLSMFTGIPGLGYAMGKAMDSTAMGYGLGTGTTSDDDDTGNGDGGNREQYGAVGQYSGPPSDVVAGEGIITLPTTPLNFIQRFKVKEPYVQASGEDYVANLQAIADRMKNFYTV